MNGDPVEQIAENLEALESTVNVIRATVDPEPQAAAVQAVVVDVNDGGWQEHPEAYLPRIIVYVREKKSYYELLRDGQATGPWTTSPEGRGFEFWIVDTDRMKDLGMSRC